MRPRQTLAFKVVATGAVCLLLALGSIALTLWVTWQLEGGAAAVNEAGRLRMMTYRLALEAASGESARLPARAQLMDSTLELLRTGDPSRPLFVPWNDEAQRAFDLVRGHWPALRDRWLAGTPVAIAEIGGFVDGIDYFVSVVEQRLSYWTEVLRGVQLAMVMLALLGAMLLFLATHLMVLEPLRRLDKGLHSIRDADFAARVQVSSNDEFGELADGFNEMAEHLQALYGDLEGKVREKTARLELKRQRTGSLYEVSAFIGQAETLDALARGFASKIRRIAGADAAAIRWSDAGNERYLMLAEDGLPAGVVENEQCLSTGVCRCGQPAATAATQVIPIARIPESGLGHCARAGFAMLLTVPVSLHQQILGEIDLFYRRPQEVDDDQRSLLETLASHLAGGIESLRVAAAEKEAAIANERSLIARELHDSIAQALAFLKIQVGLLRDAVRRGDASAVDHVIDEIDAGVRESYGDVRELLLHFRTRASAEDIEEALRNTVSKFEHQTGLMTDLEIEGHGVPLPADVQVQVLHVVQEALSNVRKHAGASRVRISVQATPQWRFEVSDDGRGFDTAAKPGRTHVGLRIMRERAERIGAKVDVTSAPGAGTRVMLTVPRAASPAVVQDVPDERADTPAGR